MNEQLINRMRMAIPYCSMEELREKFPELSEDQFFLAMVAALCLEKPREI